jgi:hypothetical protein
MNDISTNVEEEIDWKEFEYCYWCCYYDLFLELFELGKAVKQPVTTFDDCITSIHYFLSYYILK